MADDLYLGFLEGWNRQDASALGALFADDAVLIGFDGTLMTGAASIEKHLADVFADHPTGQYVGLVREVRALGPGVTMVRADAGMCPPGSDDLRPEVTARQVLVAVGGRIVLLQTTPAALHGRPEEVEALTDELREIWRK